jgi:AcrR family transcriptional regulator
MLQVVNSHRRRIAGKKSPSTRIRLETRRLRQQEILSASAGLFAESGYDATPMRAIADKIKMDPSTIYCYFDSKEDILFAILRQLEAARLRSTLGLPRQADSLERIEWFSRRYFAHLLEWFEIATIAARDGRRLHPARKAVIESAMTRHITRFAQLINQGRSDGLVRRDIDVLFAAVGLLGMAHDLAGVAREAADPSAAGVEYSALVTMALRAT